jgi:regulator of extracellular matrix RemA (YlzA/DUF370 family)
MGFGNHLAMNRVLAVIAPNAAPTKRLIREGRNRAELIDMTNGRRTKAVLVMDSGHIVLAAINPETVASRLQSTRATGIPTDGSAAF